MIIRPKHIITWDIPSELYKVYRPCSNCIYLGIGHHLTSGLDFQKIKCHMFICLNHLNYTDHPNSKSVIFYFEDGIRQDEKNNVIGLHSWNPSSSINNQRYTCPIGVAYRLAKERGII